VTAVTPSATASKAAKMERLLKSTKQAKSYEAIDSIGLQFFFALQSISKNS
jgi:hypothetical protein